MKKIILAMCMLLSAQSFAAGLPRAIQDKLGKTGTLEFLIDGKKIAAANGLSCQIVMDSETNTLTIEAGIDYTQVAGLDGAKIKESSSEAKIITKNSGRRPGGSVCGNTMRPLRYELSISAKANEVRFVEDYRCFRSSKLERVCKF